MRDYIGYSAFFEGDIDDVAIESEHQMAGKSRVQRLLKPPLQRCRYLSQERGDIGDSYVPPILALWWLPQCPIVEDVSGMIGLHILAN